MSLPSASGDERYGDSRPQNSRFGAGRSKFQSLDGLPHPRSNSEVHRDHTPGDTPSSPSLPAVDGKQDEKRALPGMSGDNYAPHRSLKTGARGRSRTAKLEADEKPYAGEVDSEDEKSSKMNDLAEDLEYDSDDVLTVYDAVAGRLGYDGLVKPNQQPVAASEYLFRFQQGPEYDQSYEQFSAHRHLEHRLPDSDLLKAIHAYASDFYGALPDGQDSFGSMDETALIAMGILLEEATVEGLGGTGDLAFVEAANPNEANRPPPVDRRIKRQKTKHEGDIKFERDIKAESELSDENPSSGDRGQKRRREAATAATDFSTEDGDDTEPAEEGPSHNSDVESWISQTLLDSQGQSSSHFGTPSDLPIR